MALTTKTTSPTVISAKQEHWQISPNGLPIQRPKSQPKVDELLEKGRFSTDPAEREAAYKEVQQIVRDEAPWVFMIFNENASATGANVKGFKQHPAGHYRLYPVYFE